MATVTVKPKTRNATPRDLVQGFATLVIKARIEKGWSKRELARQANLSAMCISDLEAEHRSPSLRVAGLIAETLGLKIDLRDLAALAKHDNLPRGVSKASLSANGRPPVKRKHVARKRKA